MRVLIILLAAILNTSAWADCRNQLDHAQLSGKGALCLLGFCLYDAQLWSTQTPPSYDTPFALQITYRRAITRARLIETAVDEIRRLNVPPPPDSILTQWQAAMTPAFIDVKPGDTLCGN